MFAPGGWVPSSLARHVHYDAEGKFVENRIDSTSEGGFVGNQLYATDAQVEAPKATFLARNIAQDQKTRGYEVQPGGRCCYANSPAPEDPYEAVFPESSQSFGHESFDARNIGLPVGRPFSLGRR